MEISDKDVLAAVQNMCEATGKDPEQLLGYSSLYFGKDALSSLSLPDITMSFQLLEGDELAELIGDITSRCGRDVNFIHGRDLGGYIRWTCYGYVGNSTTQKAVVIYTPIFLDKRSAFLLIDNRMPVENTGKYFAARYDEPYFDFKHGKINRLVVNNDIQNGIHTAAGFSTGLDRLYSAIVLEKLADRDLIKIKDKTSLLKHDLFLDYRIENISVDLHDAIKSRQQAENAAIVYAARKQLSNVLGYSNQQELRPWLDLEYEVNAPFTERIVYKNIYVHQKKYDIKVSTILGQYRVGSTYSQFIGAVYADAFIHQHENEIMDAFSRLNFPNHRIPLRCICPKCMDIPRKRGPQQRSDTLYYSPEYSEAQVNVKAIS